jgi:hypothetical protein
MIEVTQETVIAANGGYERHPESFPLRVIAYVMGEKKFYELLMTGEAITWGEIGPPDTIDFWIVDVPTISHLGVHRHV